MFSDIDEFKEYLAAQPNFTDTSKSVLVSTLRALDKRIERLKDRFDARLILDHKISLDVNRRKKFNLAWKTYSEFSKLKGVRLPDVYLDEVPNLIHPLALDALIISAHLGPRDTDRQLLSRHHLPTPQERLAAKRIEEYSIMYNGSTVPTWRIRSWITGMERAKNVKVYQFVTNVLETIRLIGGSAFELDSWILTVGRSYKRLLERKAYGDLETQVTDILLAQPRRENPVRDACEKFLRLVPPDIAIHRRIAKPAVIPDIILPDGSTLLAEDEAAPALSEETESNLTNTAAQAIVPIKGSVPTWVNGIPQFTNWRKQ
jgi:hypothetical protein